jgi:aryl-alcohol dehydrogenase-like predicted oxidoreductase
MVQKLRFNDDLEIPVPGFGAMGISFALGNNLSYDEAEPVLLKAMELGCTFWDTAVSYRNGMNEKILGDFIRKHNCRDQLFSMSPLCHARWVQANRCVSAVASKCGVAVFEDGKVTNKATHIKSYIDGTIERLGFTPDLYYLHRLDASQ